MSSAEAQEVYNRRSSIEQPMEAQEHFSEQFDLTQPEQAMSSYQKFVITVVFIYLAIADSTLDSCTNTPNNNMIWSSDVDHQDEMPI